MGLEAFIVSHMIFVADNGRKGLKERPMLTVLLLTMIRICKSVPPFISTLLDPKKVLLFLPENRPFAFICISSLSLFLHVVKWVKASWWTWVTQLNDRRLATLQLLNQAICHSRCVTRVELDKHCMDHKWYSWLLVGTFPLPTPHSWWLTNFPASGSRIKFFLLSLCLFYHWYMKFICRSHFFSHPFLSFKQAHMHNK